MSKREIEPKLVEYIDVKLKLNGAAQESILKKDARKIFVFAAEALMGIREKTNRNDGPMVELIQKTIGNANGEAWCMAYIQTCLAYAELKSGVLSKIYPSEHCLTVWQKTDPSQRVLIKPKRGAIVIWNHLGTSNGHTGIVDEFEHEPGKMMTYEGNTSAGLRPDGEIEREGGGTYHCERSIKPPGRTKLLGFLKPF
jgi:hypothetical protein